MDEDLFSRLRMTVFGMKFLFCFTLLWLFVLFACFSKILSNSDVMNLFHTRRNNPNELIGNELKERLEHSEDCWRKRGSVEVGEELDKVREDKCDQSTSYTWMTLSKKKIK